MNTPLSPKINFSQTLLIFLGLLGGQILFFFVAVFILTPTPNETFTGFIQYLFPVLTLSLLVAGNFLYLSRKRTFMENKSGNFSLVEKINFDRSARLLKYALFEAGNIICLLGYILTVNSTLLILFFVGLLTFLLNYPGANRFAKDYQLSKEEIELLTGSPSYPGAATNNNFFKTIIIVFFIAFGVGLVVFSLKEKMFSGKFTPELTNELINKCVKETGLSSYYPQEAQKYCECTNEKILNSFTYSEIMENQKLSQEEQHKIYKEITDGCFSEHFKAIMKK